jgi:prephenate dehydrogenase
VKNITIIGLGLIGGSIGLALKRAGLKDTELIGYARNQQKGLKALKLGAVDKVDSDLISAVGKSDMVVIAVPALAMEEILAQIGHHLPVGCIVTDTVSTKVKVMEWAEKYLPPRIEFIGGHPMAGKELSGIEAAEASLFEGRTYCLVPAPNVSPEAVQTVVGLVKQIGAIPFLITAAEHDRFVAGISHLPTLLSVALVSTTTRSPFWGTMSELAATGYRDVTRLASQDPRMNQDIFLTNKQNILSWIDGFAEELNQLRQLVAQGGEGLGDLLVQVKQARQKWLEEHEKKN